MSYTSKYAGQKLITYGYEIEPNRTPEDVASDWGWRDIVLRLIDDLFDLGWNGTLLQIKEKFGTLRFYIGEGSYQLWDRIQEAEKESALTCFHCGQVGKLRRDLGWMLTLCDQHYVELNGEL